LIISLGISAYWGTILLIGVAAVLKTNSVQIIFPVVFLIALLSNLIQFRLLKGTYTKSSTQISFSELLTILGVFIAYFLIFCRHTTLDTINHFFLAEQISLDKIPPSIHGFPDVPAKYHYGWDLLLGIARKNSHLNFAGLSSFLTLLMIFANVAIVADYLKRRNYNGFLFSFALILIFLGGGLFSIASSLIMDSTGNGLSLSALFGQSSWLFGVGFLFVLLNSLEGLNPNNRNIIIAQSILIFPFLLSVGILSASAYVLIMLYFVICILYLLTNFKLRSVYKLAIAIVVYFIAFFYLSRIIGGMLVDGPGYDSPILIIAPLRIDFDVYATRVAAYLFALAPVGLIMLGYLIWKYIKKPITYFRETVHDLFLNTVGLGLFCFPLLIWVENSAYWDNFCKFNNYGILASWLIIADGPVRSLIHRRSLKKSFLLVILLILFSNESIIKIYNSLATPNSIKSYKEAVRRNESLIYAVKAEIPLNSRIYLLNKDLQGMYEVDWEISKSKINLYKYIGENFGDFTLIAMETGRSVVNFYDYNMFVNRTMEYGLWTNMDKLLKGQTEILNQIRGEYIISRMSFLPEYIDNWIDQGYLEIIKQSEVKNWIILRIN